MEPTNELAEIGQEKGLATNKIEELLLKFNDKFNEAKELTDKSQTITVTSEDQVKEMREARVKRLAIRKVRTETENIRKAAKEQSLREGQTIDLMARKIKEICEPVEAHLEAQEKFAELRAAERKAKRFAERIELLTPYVDDTQIFDLENMEDAAFDSLLESSKRSYEALKEAEAKAEAERLAKEKAEAEERERIRLENIRLKEEAEKREAELAAERAEQEKRLAEERAKAEAERRKREEAEAKIRAEKEAEERRQAEAEEAKRQALIAPDKDKLLSFADVLDALEMPNVASREAGVALDETKDFLTRISKNLRQKASAL